MVDVSPGTIVVYSDVGCPWAHLSVFRLLTARARVGLEGAVVLDHRPFALEIVNRRPTPWRIVSTEIPVIGALDPSAGWQVWQAGPWTWPVTTLPALEAVQAAKEQGLAASERLDRALRLAFFGQSRCISLHHVILEVAEEAGIDVKALQAALEDGRARRQVMDRHREATEGPVKGSPHLFFPDGTDVHNPGIEMEWLGEHGVGFPVVAKDDPAIYDELVRRAADG